MQRRSFLGAMLAAGVAPAVVKAGVLMPVRQIWTPPKVLEILGAYGKLYPFTDKTVDLYDDPHDPFGQRGFIPAEQYARAMSGEIGSVESFRFVVSPLF